MAKLQTKQTFFLFFLLLAWIIQEPNAVIWQQVQPHQSLSEKVRNANSSSNSIWKPLFVDSFESSNENKENSFISPNRKVSQTDLSEVHSVCFQCVPRI